MTSIGTSAFSGCSGLTSVSIPNSVTSIGTSAFSGCSGLTSFTIPNKVTAIELSTFNNCSSLTSIIIPDGVTSIGSYAFSDCGSLTSVSIPNSVTSIDGYTFYNCSGLTSVTIGNSVTSIGAYTFYNCSSLTSIIIPDGVTSIGFSSFEGCSSLYSVTIGSAVTTIASKAFYDCFKLETIKMLPTTPPSAQENTFSNYDKTLQVPESSLNLYKNRTPWNKFTKFTTFSDGGTGDETCATPTINYQNGKITFGCETEGVDFTSSITDTDISNYTTSSIDLTVTYNISVYAHKAGYKDSETVTATLCWIDVEPKTEGITNGVSTVSAKALLIKCVNGIITIEGADDGERINVYTPAGSQEGSAISQNRLATINTHLQPGDIAIIKIGSRAVKVVMK